MSNGELAADHRDHITEVCSMTNKTQQRFVFLIDCLPIRAVHLRIVEILTLNTPRFTVDLRPLSARINSHLQLSYIQWSIANFRRSFSGDNAPTISGLVQKLFLVR